MGGVAAVVLLPFGLPVSVLGAGVFGVLAGLLSGTLVTRLRINPFIADAGRRWSWCGAQRSRTLTRARSVSLDDTFLELGSGWPLPYAFAIMVVIAIIGHVLLNSRPWGRHVYAVGADENAAAMSGLRVSRLKMQCYLISGMLAGLAGLLLAARLGTGSPIIGESTPLSAAAAALIGGASLRGGEGSIGGAHDRGSSSSAAWSTQ